jgi:hypothetical protein
MGKPEGKRPLERPRRRRQDGIKMDFREVGWGCVEWIHLAQDRDLWRAVVSAVMNLRVLAPRSYLVIILKSFIIQLYVITVFDTLSLSDFIIEIRKLCTSCNIAERLLNDGSERKLHLL